MGGGDLYGMRGAEGKTLLDLLLGCRQENYFECIA